MDEIWKDIEGYPDYMVSNMGRIKSLKFGKEKILKNRKNCRGYLQVTLLKNGIEKSYKVHRLVAETFLDNPNNLSEVNHIDEDKTNNCVSNLEFCTAEYNSNYGSRNERISKSLSKPVIQFSLDGKFIKKWKCVMDVQRELGIDNGSVSKCCKGKLKTAGKYIWRYEIEKVA